MFFSLQKATRKNSTWTAVKIDPEKRGAGAAGACRHPPAYQLVWSCPPGAGQGRVVTALILSVTLWPGRRASRMVTVSSGAGGQGGVCPSREAGPRKLSEQVCACLLDCAIPGVRG